MINNWCPKSRYVNMKSFERVWAVSSGNEFCHIHLELNRKQMSNSNCPMFDIKYVEYIKCANKVNLSKSSVSNSLGDVLFRPVPSFFSSQNNKGSLQWLREMFQMTSATLPAIRKQSLGYLLISHLSKDESVREC